MAITARLRYEVLRRDAFTCQYCRDSESPLTVDHVIPRAVGGDDHPSNLVAACFSCNLGKSSTLPNADMVCPSRSVLDDLHRLALYLDRENVTHWCVNSEVIHRKNSPCITVCDILSLLRNEAISGHTALACENVVENAGGQMYFCLTCCPMEAVVFNAAQPVNSNSSGAF